MKTLQYSLRLDIDVYPSEDADFTVSTPFNKSDVIENLAERLNKVNYRPDLESLRFVVKDNQLYVEGLAHEQQPPTEFSYDFI